MALRSTQDNYGTAARVLHWTCAGLVVVMVILGLTMTRIDGGDNTTMYRVHVAIGLLVAALTLIRVIWRFLEPAPDAPPMPAWRRTLYLGNHYGLYIGLFLLAGTGIATLIASDLTPFPPDVTASEVEDSRPRDAHFALGLIYTGLFLMHIIGVMTYQRTKGDVVSKMGLNFPATTSQASNQ